MLTENIWQLICLRFPSIFALLFSRKIDQRIRYMCECVGSCHTQTLVRICTRTTNIPWIYAHRSRRRNTGIFIRNAQCVWQYRVYKQHRSPLCHTHHTPQTTVLGATCYVLEFNKIMIIVVPKNRSEMHWPASNTRQSYMNTITFVLYCTLIYRCHSHRILCVCLCVCLHRIWATILIFLDCRTHKMNKFQMIVRHRFIFRHSHYFP